ncbi:hypothetical protein [Methylocapsa palsarum]|uniref:hypothetical protein n=1 Tax=Methylocapsa palsarum TaxID=1612308 RepID=UPI0015873277|nr:hypothetical protein [Methylocapsa palsarum]
MSLKLSPSPELKKRPLSATGQSPHILAARRGLLFTGAALLLTVPLAVATHHASHDPAQARLPSFTMAIGPAR